MRYQTDENGCWNYLGSLDKTGYGKVKFKGGTYRAHRFMAHLTIKPLMSDDQYVGHKCDNPRCINPDHLFITTALGNMQDRDAKGRGPIGERSSLAKLTANDVREIRDQYSKGLSYSKIAKNFPQITAGCIQAIISRRTWKHIV